MQLCTSARFEIEENVISETVYLDYRTLTTSGERREPEIMPFLPTYHSVTKRKKTMPDRRLGFARSGETIFFIEMLGKRWLGGDGHPPTTDNVSPWQRDPFQ